MSFRERLASSTAILATAALMMLPGCSPNQPRDLQWGTDADVGFVPPDTAVGDDADATVEESGNSADGSSGDVSVDESLDEAGYDLDASIDGAN
jgi:hypothetical protein